MKTIKLAFVGMGRRGPGQMENVLKNFQEVDVVAVCDVYPDRVENAQRIVKEIRGTDCKGYTDYKELLKNDEIEAVVVTASWEDHIKIAVDAMKAGKITAMEVGGAYSIDECWQLVHTWEETQTPFMFLENCCYGRNELLANSLVRHGNFGEIVNCHGAYVHDCRPQIADGVKIRHYRQRNYLNRNCDNYPTHDLGPIAKILNINRGNRMVSLVSVASKARGMHTYVNSREGYDTLHERIWAQGDIVETIISCADGATISLKLSTTLPHPYTREFSVYGTKGCYREDGDIVFEDCKNYEKGHWMYENIGSAKEYEAEYLPECWKNITPEEIEAGHGGMDIFMWRAFFDAIQNGKEMPIDVYDAASWMVISCLSEHSVRTGGHPVDIPDFTNGKWLLRSPKDVVNFNF